MRMHVFDDAVLIVVVLNAGGVKIIVSPGFGDRLLYRGVCIVVSSVIGTVYFIVACETFDSDVLPGQVIDFSVFAYFDVVGSSMSLGPVPKLWCLHIDCVIRVTFFHREINSRELSCFIDVSFKFFRALDHVFELVFVVNVVSNLIFLDDLCLQDTPFKVDL